jgi:hypothetical protein
MNRTPYAYWSMAHLLRGNPALPLHAKSLEAVKAKMRASAALLYTMSMKESEESVIRFLARQAINKKTDIEVIGKWYGIGTMRQYANDKGGHYGRAMRAAIDAAVFNRGPLNRLSLEDANTAVMTAFPHTWSEIWGLIICNDNHLEEFEGDIALAVLREWDVFYNQFDIPQFTEEMAKALISPVYFDITRDSFMVIWGNREVEGNVYAIDDGNWHSFSGRLENVKTVYGNGNIQGVGWYVAAYPRHKEVENEN